MNQIKTQMLTNTVSGFGGLVLRCYVCFQGKELGGATLTAQGVLFPLQSLLQEEHRMLFSLFAFFCKREKFSLDFFQLVNRY